MQTEVKTNWGGGWGWGGEKETVTISVASTLSEGRQRQAHQKLFKIATCVSNSTLQQGCCIDTADHKIKRQSILQSSITLILERRGYVRVLQAKGTLQGSGV